MTVAVVLAAGVGRRLNHPVPKWLAPVANLCPAAVQLPAIVSSGITEVLVVVGPQIDAVRRYLEPWQEDLNLRLIVNEQHATLNNWYSLLHALWVVPPGDVLVLNSDLFAAPAWLAQTVSQITASTTEAALAIDQIRPLTDEAMKVEVNDSQQVRRIGKLGLDSATGEYVGMSWWTESAALALRGHLEQYIERPGAENNWYEHAIDDHLQAGGRYAVVPVPSTAWVEIDEPADLEVATALAAEL